MVYFVSNSRQTRTRFETLAKDFECAFFMTFTGLERELRSLAGCYSVVIDENLEMAACLSFISRHYSDRNLKKILMISSQTEGAPSLPDDRISICSYSEFEDRLSQLRGKDEDDDGLASLLLGDSPAMVHLRSEVKRIGAAGHNVLVYGPTGSGKELVAKALHAAYSKKAPSMLNCALLDSSLLESHLFGHRKGSFSGADSDFKGIAETANGSSIILDEFEAMPMLTQAKLLRFIDTGEYYRVGENVPRYSKCRIIALSNEPIGQLLDDKRLRFDFLMRIAVTRINVPALKDHLEDIGTLVRSREAKCVYKDHIRDIEGLKRYPWPGNVRQLFNVVDSIHTDNKCDKSIDMEDFARGFY